MWTGEEKGHSDIHLGRLLRNDRAPSPVEWPVLVSEYPHSQLSIISKALVSLVYQQPLGNS